MAVRAAARANVSTSAGRTSTRTAATKRAVASGNGGSKSVKRAGFVRTSSSSLHPGIVGRDSGHVRQFRRRGEAKENVKAVAVPAVGRTQDCEDGGKGGGVETSEDTSSMKVFNPVTLFRCSV